MKLKPEELFQFVLLGALIIFNSIFMWFNKGNPNDTIIGLLGGLLVGLPIGAIAQRSHK